MQGTHGWIQHAPFLHPRPCAGHVYPAVRDAVVIVVESLVCGLTYGERFWHQSKVFNVEKGRGRQRLSRSGGPCQA